MSQDPNLNPQPRTATAGTSVLFAALVISASATVATGVYGFKNQSSLLLAVGFQLALAATTSWACLDARRIRGLQLTATISDDADADLLKRQLREAQAMHLVFLATPVGVVAFLAGFQLWQWRIASAADPLLHSTAIAMCCLAGSCLWFVLSKSIATLGAAGASRQNEQLPEAPALSLVFRESQWVSLVAGGALLFSSVLPSVADRVGIGMLLWIVAVSAEQLVRAGCLWFFANQDKGLQSPLGLVLRSALLVAATR